MHNDDIVKRFGVDRARRAAPAAIATLASAAALTGPTLVADAGLAAPAAAALAGLLMVAWPALVALAVMLEAGGRVRHDRRFEQCARDVVRPSAALAVGAVIAAAVPFVVQSWGRAAVVQLAAVLIAAGLTAAYSVAWRRMQRWKLAHLILGAAAAAAAVVAPLAARLVAGDALARPQLGFAAVLAVLLGASIGAAYGALRSHVTHDADERDAYRAVAAHAVRIAFFALVPLPWTLLSFRAAAAAGEGASRPAVELLALTGPLLVATLFVVANWRFRRDQGRRDPENTWSDTSPITIATIVSLLLWLVPSRLLGGNALDPLPLRDTAAALAILLTVVGYLIRHGDVLANGARTSALVLSLGVAPLVYCAYGAFASDGARAGARAAVLERSVNALRQQVVAAAGEPFTAQADTLKKLRAMEDELPPLKALARGRFAAVNLGVSAFAAILLVTGFATVTESRRRQARRVEMATAIAVAAVVLALGLGASALPRPVAAGYRELQLVIVVLGAVVLGGVRVGSPAGTTFDVTPITPVVHGPYLDVVQAFLVMLLVAATAIGTHALGGAATAAGVPAIVRRGPAIVAVASLVAATFLAAVFRATVQRVPKPVGVEAAHPEVVAGVLV